MLNIERKFVGESLFGTAFAALDATSAMSLLMPAIDIVSSGEDR